MSMDPASSDTHDLVLGRLALERKVVSADQLRQSLSIQAQSAEIGLKVSLSEVFRKKGFAGEAQLRVLEQERRFLRNRFREEEAIGRWACEAGLVEKEALEEILDRVKMDRETPAVEDLLLDAGQIDEPSRNRIVSFRIRRTRKASAELLETLAESAGGAVPETHAGEVEAGTGSSGTLPPEGWGTPPPAPVRFSESDATISPEAAREAGPSHPPISLPGLSSQDEGGAVAYTKDGQPILGEYEVLRELGRGAMGVVYEAVQKSLNRRVALKVLPAELVMNEKRVRRFRLEAEAAGNLDHPGIVKVFGMGEQGGIHYFAMEYIEGKTFEGLIDEGTLPFRRACKLICQAADALQYAHEQGVIHRDIKPANIMVQPDGTVRVMDFGLARQEATESSLTASGAVLGTPAYMSPEQATGEKGNVDRRTDVYALGATLYEMLTSMPPIDFEEDEGVHSVLRRVMEEAPVPPNHRNRKIPVNLSTVILKALFKDPASRYQSAEAFKEDLERFLRGDPVVARPVGSATKIWMKVRKRKAVTGLILLAVLTAVLAPLIFIVSREQALQERGETKLAEAQAALEAGNADRAEALAAYVIKSFSDRALEIRARKIVARAKAEGPPADYFDALARLMSVGRGEPAERWAMARLLESLVDIDRSAPALALAEVMAERFPASEEGLLALRVLGESMLKAGRLNEARRSFDRLVEAGSATEDVERELERLKSVTPILDLPYRLLSAGTGDVDGDGVKELVLATPKDLVLLRKQGDRLEEIARKTVTDASRGDIGCVEIADLDGDGDGEILLAYGKPHSKNPGALEIWEPAEGELRRTWRFLLEGRCTLFRHGALCAADVDCDGSPEIVLGESFYGRRIEFFRREGDGYRLYSTWISGKPPYNSDVVGIDVGNPGTELPQVAAALAHWNDYCVSLIEQEPGSDRFFLTSSHIVGHPAGVALEDLDGDGICEIVTANQYTKNTVLFGPGKQFGEIPKEDLFVFRFRPRKLMKIGGVDLTENAYNSGVMFVDAADLDGDGRGEIYVLYYERTSGGRKVEKLDRFLLADGALAGETLLEMEAGLGTRYEFLDFGDVDGDGKDEIILLGYQGKVLGFDG